MTNEIDIQQLLTFDGHTLLTLVRNPSLSAYVRGAAVSVMLINGYPQASLPELAGLVADVRKTNPELPEPRIAVPVAAPQGAPSASVTSTSINAPVEAPGEIAALRAELAKSEDLVQKLKAEIAELHQDIADLSGSAAEVAHESEAEVA